MLSFVSALHCGYLAAISPQALISIDDACRPSGICMMVLPSVPASAALVALLKNVTCVVIAVIT